MVLERFRGGSSDDDEDVEEEQQLIMPTDPRVIKKVSKVVDLSREDVDVTLEEFQDLAYRARRAIRDQAMSSPSATQQAKGEAEYTWIYRIYEDDHVLVTGGAKNVMMTLAESLGFDSAQKQAVMLAHKITAEQDGFSEHIVMDDVFLVPKDGSGEDDFSMGDESASERDEKLKRKMEEVRRVKDEGYLLEATDRLAEAVDLEQEKFVGVEADPGEEGLELRIRPGKAKDSTWVGVVLPGGDMLLPPELDEVFDLDSRDVSWGMRAGELVGRMLSIDDEQPPEGEAVKTSVSEDGIDGTYRVMLPGSHLKRLGTQEGDYAAFYLEPFDGEFHVVVSPGEDEGLEVDNSGAGADVYSITLPEASGSVLDIEDGTSVEWTADDDRMVGKVSQ